WMSLRKRLSQQVASGSAAYYCKTSFLCLTRPFLLARGYCDLRQVGFGRKEHHDGGAVNCRLQVQKAETRHAPVSFKDDEFRSQLDHAGIFIAHHLVVQDAVEFVAKAAAAGNVILGAVESLSTADIGAIISIIVIPAAG